MSLKISSFVENVYRIFVIIVYWILVGRPVSAILNSRKIFDCIFDILISLFFLLLLGEELPDQTRVIFSFEKLMCLLLYNSGWQENFIERFFVSIRRILKLYNRKLLFAIKSCSAMISFIEEKTAPLLSESVLVVANFIGRDDGCSEWSVLVIGITSLLRNIFLFILYGQSE